MQGCGLYLQKNNVTMKNNKLKGYLCAIIAAIAYGTNPLGALFLYKESFNTSSVIFYRYTFAIIILWVILLIKNVPMKINKYEFKILSSLGVLFAASSLSLFSSFNYMDSGIASTILFSYPIIVAIIMTVFFKEKASWLTIISIILSALGIIMLYQGDGTAKLSTVGVILVFISSFTYAVYIVIVNCCKITMSSFKMTFYIMIFAYLTVFVFSLFGEQNHIILIPSVASLGWILMLALVPTVIAMVMLNIGIFYAGSTPTAILGALEPVTAVIISITIFNGIFTLRLSVGIIFILLAVMLIVVGKTIFSKNKALKQ